MWPPKAVVSSKRLRVKKVVVMARAWRKFRFHDAARCREVQLNALAAQEARVIASMEATGNPGDAASMLKIIGSEARTNLRALRVEAIGHYSLPFEVSLIRGEVTCRHLGQTMR